MINEAIRVIYNFVLRLRIEIKLMPETDFEHMLNDETLDMKQKFYLLYFRYW